MPSNKGSILTINVGSSSIKFALYENGESLERIVVGEITRIGLEGSAISVKDDKGQQVISETVSIPDHKSASDAILKLIEMNPWGKSIQAIGHRVVHGGPKYSKPEKITEEVIEELRSLIPFDPMHLPQEILVIQSFQKRFPELLQVACFDTAFHHDLPKVSQLLPIPRRYFDKGVRRFGFHGLSYEFLMKKLNPHRLHQGKVILAHLGNGVSLAAVLNGKPIDTSMCFTPIAGVCMSTRSGDLDPGLFNYLAKTEGLNAEQFNDLISFQSGLLGVSEVSSDMKDLLEREKEDIRAKEAIDLFCMQIKKCIGAYAATLNGVDTLVFAGGMGEKASEIRARICKDLTFLGIKLDERRNRENASVISVDTAICTVRVIHTDEEWMIATHIIELQKFVET